MHDTCYIVAIAFVVGIVVSAFELLRKLFSYARGCHELERKIEGTEDAKEEK